MIVLYIIIGGVIGVLGTALILNGKRKSVEAQWLLAGQQLAQEQASVHTLQILLDAAEKERTQRAVDATQSGSGTYAHTVGS